MALLVCEACTTKYSVGAPACPHCGSLEHYEEGSVMPKITVHGGPSIAGETPMPLTRGEHVLSSEAAAEAAGQRRAELQEDLPTVSVSVDGVDQGPSEVVEFTGEPSFEPLPAAVEGENPSDIENAMVVPEAWTVAELKAELDKREVQYPSRATKDELVGLLQADQDAKAEASDG